MYTAARRILGQHQIMRAKTWRPQGLIALAGSIQPEDFNLLSTNPL
jgi:hypothetical protein